jgi:hypothetical protein
MRLILRVFPYFSHQQGNLRRMQAWFKACTAKPVVHLEGRPAKPLVVCGALRGWAARRVLQHTGPQAPQRVWPCFLAKKRFALQTQQRLPHEKSPATAGLLGFQTFSWL